MQSIVEWLLLSVDSVDSGSSARDVCLKFLLDQMSELAGKEVLFDLADVNFNSHVSTNLFQLGPFCISRGLCISIVNAFHSII